MKRIFPILMMLSFVASESSLAQGIALKIDSITKVSDSSCKLYGSTFTKENTKMKIWFEIGLDETFAQSTKSKADTINGTVSRNKVFSKNPFIKPNTAYFARLVGEEISKPGVLIKSKAIAFETPPKFEFSITHPGGLKLEIKAKPTISSEEDSIKIIPRVPIGFELTDSLGTRVLYLENTNRQIYLSDIEPGNYSYTLRTGDFLEWGDVVVKK